MPRIIGIIPARYASTRFPGKPLIDIGGKSMIRRVYDQAQKATSLKKVYVATDDERIAEHVRSFTKNVLLTSASHESGTDRCAELLRGISKAAVVINIQGDEPFIDPAQIDLVASCFSDPRTQIATLYKKLPGEEDVRNPNIVKVVMNAKERAIYFSRSPVPYRRNPGADITYYRHIGIYGYRADILQEITRLPVGELEKAESLEQLRWLEHGYRIRMKETTMETLAIDTPDDLRAAERMLSS